MPLALTVLLVVLGVTVLTAIGGYLIDKSEENDERKEFTRISER